MVDNVSHNAYKIVYANYAYRPNLERTFEVTNRGPTSYEFVVALLVLLMVR